MARSLTLYWKQCDRIGRLLSIISIFSPFLVIITFTHIVSGLIGEVSEIGKANLNIQWNSQPDAPLSGQELATRMTFAMASVGVVLTSVVGWSIAMFVILLPYGMEFILISVCFGAVGGFVGLLVQWLNPIRAVVADCELGKHGVCPLDQAVTARIIPSGVLEHAQSVVNSNWMLGVSTSFMLVFVLSVIVAHSPRGFDGPHGLRHRRTSLLRIVALIAILLSFSVICTRGFYTWSSVLAEDKTGKLLESYANSVGIFWGSAFTSIALASTMIASFGIGRDIDRAAKEATLAQGESFADRMQWLAREGLEFSPTRAIGSIVLAAGPLLAGSGLDILSGLR